MRDRELLINWCDLLMRVNSIDIAIAVGHILDQCTHEVVPYGMKSSGEEKANRNGDIVVHAVLKQ
jgi:hypothetical protein